MAHTFWVKNCLTLYSIYIWIDITLLRTVADDLLNFEKIEKWCLFKLTVWRAFVIGSHCSKFQSVKQASGKKIFTNHLGLRIISLNNLQKWEKWYEKEMGVVETVKNFKHFKKLDFLGKKKNYLTQL